MVYTIQMITLASTYILYSSYLLHGYNVWKQRRVRIWVQETSVIPNSSWLSDWKLYSVFTGP